MSDFGRRPITVSAKSGWRARGYSDGYAGRPYSEVPAEHRGVYLEGYRVGVKKRERVDGG